MDTGERKIKPWQLIILLVLLAGVGVGIYLTQKTQIFKPKAAVNLLSAFEIKDANGNILNCRMDSDGVTPVCDTPTLDVSIRVKDVNALNQ